MNPDQPSREQIEARLTALLLGELPADEAALLRWAIAHDAELKKLHDQLQLAIGLVREVAVKPTAAGPLKLADARRQKLLAHFQTPRPKPAKELFWLKRIELRPLATALVLVAVVALLAAISIPNFVKARATSQANSIINNLRQIDAAKNQWALENKKSADAVASMDDLKPYLSKDFPPSVAGEKYIVGKVSEPVVADIDVAHGKKLGGIATRLPAGGQSGGRLRLSADGVVDENAAVQTYSMERLARQKLSLASTVALSPVVAPPPAEIVLPKSEPEIAVGNPVAAGGMSSIGATEEFRNAGLASPAGTLTIDPATGLPAAGDRLDREKNQHTFDTQKRMAQVENQFGMVPPHTLDAGVAFSSAGGGSGGGGASGGGGRPQLAGNNSWSDGSIRQEAEHRPADTVQNGVTLAWNDNIGDRSQTEGQQKNVHHGFVLGGPVGNGGDAWQKPEIGYGLAANDPVAGKRLPGVSAAAAGKDTDQYLTGGLRDTITTSGSFNFDTADQTQNRSDAGERFYRNAGSGSDAEKVTVLGDVPVAGKLFSSASRVALAPVVATAPAPAQKPGKSEWGYFDGSINEPVTIAEGTKELPKSGSGTLALTGANAYTGGTTVNGGTLTINGLATDNNQPADKSDGFNLDVVKLKAAKKESGDQKVPAFNWNLGEPPPAAVASPKSASEAMDNLSGATTDNSGSFYLGATKDDVNGMRYLITTNQAQREEDRVVSKPSLPAPTPQPEILCRENNFSTFSLNVSDVSFKLAAASLEKGRLPDAASIRSEEFINAFDYRDPEAAAGQPVAFTSERARYPFAQNRDLLRFSIKTAAAGRAADRPLNLVLLLDKSGSMERADRVAIIREALRVLAAQLQPQDTVSVVTFARTARLWADGVAGDKAGETLSQVGGITPEGGTNLEEAMRLAYETARRHYLASGINRVVLLTDGAANLGNVDAAMLKQKVEAQRKQGIALDCFGIGWEDFNDDMLAELSGNGDGRYAFINTPEDAGTEFAAKLAGALQVAAQDVKVQVEFNPQRVVSWRQIGYAKHQLTKEQFRDNSVLAAEIAAREAGNALYTVETKPDGIGPVATVHVRYKIPGTDDVQEHEWEVPYTGNALSLEQSSAAMRLAATASAFSEWLAASPFAQEVSPDELLKGLSGVPEIYGADQRPKKLEWMIRQAKSLSGK